MAPWFKLLIIEKFGYLPDGPKETLTLTVEDLHDFYKQGWNDCVAPDVDYDYFHRIIPEPGAPTNK